MVWLHLFKGGHILSIVILFKKVKKIEMVFVKK